MGVHAVPVDELYNQFFIRLLCLYEKRDVGRVPTKEVGVLEVGRLGSFTGCFAGVIEARRVREKARVWTRRCISRNVRIRPDFIVILIQCLHRET